MKQLFPLLAAFFLLVLATIYLSLRTSPAMVEVPLMPEWLGVWADANPDRRTAVPFSAGAFLWVMLCALGRWLAVERDGNVRIRYRVADGLITLAALLGTLEGLQLMMPERHGTLADVGWGTAGIVAGGMLGVLMTFVLKRIADIPVVKASR